MSYAFSQEILGSWNPHLKAHEYWPLIFEVTTIEGFYIFEIVVQQIRGIIDDIIVRIFDEQNYTLWEYNLNAVKAGATSSQLPTPKHNIYSKVGKASITLKPKKKGIHYLVLDNTHSSLMGKSISVNLYWIWTGSPLRNYVKSRLEELKWHEVWEHLTNADLELENKKISESCLNLRTALVILMKKICEKKQISISLEEGKKTPISELTNGLIKYGIPKKYATLTRRIWASNSEFAHPEKFEYESPNINDVFYLQNLTWVTTHYLLSKVISS